MAAPYNLKMKFTNGKVLNAYIVTAVAVGTPLPVELNGAAIATSEKSFKVNQPLKIDDWYTDVPAGSLQVEFVKDDEPTSRYLCLDPSMASTNNARVVQKLTLSPGVYKLVVKVAGPV